MMVKFHVRTNLQQFVQNKPERWGINEWGIASLEGYLLNCDIYCGKGSNIYYSGEAAKLTKCALGSRVVLMMTQNLLSSVVSRKLIQYYLYFDNYFTNPNLLVHLKKMRLKATGKVRVNRVKVKNYVDKKAEKGTYSVKHEKNSGLNFITVMDSKCVSVLSTAAEVSPSFEVNQFSFAERKRIAILFPHAFKIFNIFMGGVDLHDLHCSNLMSCIRAKKWTWPIFMRFIQSSMANATVLQNYVHETKIGSNQLAMDIAKYYLAKAKVSKSDTSVTVSLKKNCQNFKTCASRTKRICKDCNVYLCSVCFPLLHQ